MAPAHSRKTAAAMDRSSLPSPQQDRQAKTSAIPF
jgi:hypothetical protein